MHNFWEVYGLFFHSHKLRVNDAGNYMVNPYTPVKYGQKRILEALVHHPGNAETN